MAFVNRTYKHPAPTFNVNGVKGWDTRLIYSYYGYPMYATGFQYNYWRQTSGSNPNYDYNLFEGIKDFEVSQLYPDQGGGFSNEIYSSSIYKGTYENFPSRYFKTGKTLRIKSNMIISSSGVESTPLFNMRVGIYNNTRSTYYTLGTQYQNMQSHYSPRYNYAPVSIEINIISVESYDSSSISNQLLMKAEGFYQYTNLTCISPGTCTTPLSDFNYVPIGLNDVSVYVGDITDSYILTLDFLNSVGIDAIYPSQLTIEELG
jgi:hypothetical protein